MQHVSGRHFEPLHQACLGKLCRKMNKTYTPPKLTWNPRRCPIKRPVVYEAPLFRFHACLAECPMLASSFGPSGSAFGEKHTRCRHRILPLDAFQASPQGAHVGFSRACIDPWSLGTPKEASKTHRGRSPRRVGLAPPGRSP